MRTLFNTRKITGLALLLCCLLAGCDENPCQDKIELALLELSDAGKAFNPYQPENKRVIFTDNAGAEYHFILQDNVLKTVGNNEGPGPCPDDTTQTVTFRSTYTLYKIRLIGIELATEFQILLNDVFQPNAAKLTGEELLILCPDDLQDATCLYHRINQVDRTGTVISHTDNSTLLDSVTILNKTFYDVLVPSGTGFGSSSKYRVYYNQAFGLVGFRDNATLKEYVFERIEN